MDGTYTALSACTLKARLLDKKNAQDWLNLATFAWGVGAKEQAQMRLSRCWPLIERLSPRRMHCKERNPERWSWHCRRNSAPGPTTRPKLMPPRPSPETKANYFPMYPAATNHGWH